MAASSSKVKVAPGTGVPTTVLFHCAAAAKAKPTKMPTAKDTKTVPYVSGDSTAVGQVRLEPWQTQSGSRGNSGHENAAGVQMQVGEALPAHTTNPVLKPRASSCAAARMAACMRTRSPKYS